MADDRDHRRRGWNNGASHGSTAKHVVDDPNAEGEWAGATVKRPPQPPAQPPVRRLLGPAERHQREHRPQRPTERSAPTQHAKGRPGDRPGPRTATATHCTGAPGVPSGTTRTRGAPSSTTPRRSGHHQNQNDQKVDGTPTPHANEGERGTVQGPLQKPPPDNTPHGGRGVQCNVMQESRGPGLGVCRLPGTVKSSES